MGISTLATMILVCGSVCGGFVWMLFLALSQNRQNAENEEDQKPEAQISKEI